MSFGTPDVESPEISFIEPENSSVSIFQRPPNLKGICTVDNQTTQTKQLPVIRSRTARKKLFCPLESPPCSKRAVPLPKLTQRFRHRKSIERADAGEPYSNFLPSYYVEQAESACTDEVSLPESLPWDESSVSSTEGLLDMKPSSHASEINLMKLLKKEQEKELEPSHALQRWQYWLEDKKKLQDYLSRKINRPPFDLLVQDPDRYREVVQNKRIFSIFPTPEKSRVPIAHWKPQRHMSRVKSKEKQSTCNSKVKLPKAVEERELEYIGVPDKIKVEKGFEYAMYNKQKKNLSVEKDVKCHKKIQNLLALNTERRGLVVYGNKIKQPIEEIEPPPHNLPEIVTISEETLCSTEYRQSVFCLIIGDEEIKYEPEGSNEESKVSDRNFTWQVDFGVNTVRNIAEKILRIENRGTIAVKYEWFSPEIEQKQSLNPLQPINHEPCFFFNKNSGIFLPGQLYELKIYQWAQSAGIRKERWHLKTVPPLSSSQEFGTILLSAIVTDESSDLKKNLKSYLGRRKTESTVSYIIDIILRKVFRKPEDFHYVEYRSIFNKKYLFEYQNPKYYYHSTIVIELYGLFKEVIGGRQSEWDLSLDSLIKITLNAKTGRHANGYLRKIANTAKRLLRPNYKAKQTPEKYKMVRGILCKAVSLVENDYIFLRNLFLEETVEPLYTNGWQEYYQRTEYEEIGEFDWREKETGIMMKPITSLLFRSFLYLKVYHRLCDAVECIVGVLETRKLFEPWKQVTYKIEKPAKEVRNFLEDHRLVSNCFDIPPE